MRIGELCQRTGHSKDTIRFYEKAGLLPVDPRKGGFKNYTDWHLIRLLQIKYAKAAGFTLGQIRISLDDWVSDRLTDAEKRSILTEQITKMDQAIDELRIVKNYIYEKLALIDADTKEPGLTVG